MIRGKLKTLKNKIDARFEANAEERIRRVKIKKSSKKKKTKVGKKSKKRSKK